MERTYKKGDIIYLKGDATAGVYYLGSGKVKLSFENKDDSVSANYEAGEFFGAIEHFAQSPRVSTAVTMSESVIKEYTLKDFQTSCFNDFSSFLNVIFKNIDLLKKLNNLVLKYMNADEREFDVSYEEPMYKMAEFFAKTKQPLKAVYVYEAYLKLYGDSIRAKAAEKRLTAIKENYDEMDADISDENYEKVIEIADKHFEKKNYVKAIELYRKVIVMPLPPEILFNALFKLIDSYLSAQKPLLALKTMLSYEEKLSQMENQAKRYYYLAMCYERMGNIEKAVENYKLADKGKFKELAEKKLKELPNG